MRKWLPDLPLTDSPVPWGHLLQPMENYRASDIPHFMLDAWTQPCGHVFERATFVATAARQWRCMTKVFQHALPIVLKPGVGVAWKGWRCMSQGLALDVMWFVVHDHACDSHCRKGTLKRLWVVLK